MDDQTGAIRDLYGVRPGMGLLALDGEMVEKVAHKSHMSSVRIYSESVARGERFV